MDPKDFRSNGDPAAHPRIGERIDSMGASARQFADEARGTVDQLADTLDLAGRVARHPFGMMAAAFGVGYVLAGGLFTPTTGRVVRLGMKLAALPLVKDELLGMAEAAVEGISGRAHASPHHSGRERTTDHEEGGEP